MKLRCPICRKVLDKVLLQQSRREKFFPFCSERCKWIDLGKWIDEGYKIISDLKQKNGEQKKEDE